MHLSYGYQCGDGTYSPRLQYWREYSSLSPDHSVGCGGSGFEAETGNLNISIIDR